ncbi:MAG: coenzyme F420-0:L-glutamate ligase [Patescibacteria group bacterium]|nr:coenzyme F420-0:L-glutamate ligase [Patescibacteria group bacterium]
MKTKKTMPPAADLFKPNPGKELAAEADGESYLRLPVKTRLITEHDDLMALLDEYVAPHLLPGDLLFVSEKIVALTQGRIVPIRDVKPTPLARFLAKHVDNKRGTPQFRGFGHGTGAGMQLFIEEAGYPRVLLAAAAAAITRPLGIKGLFYIISGKNAKSVDCPMSFSLFPYTNYAKLSPRDPGGVAKRVRERFGCETVIVDANYRGVYSLGKSDRRITERFIRAVFRDNPAGQSEEMTPFFIVRKEKAA